MLADIAEPAAPSSASHSACSSTSPSECATTPRSQGTRTPPSITLVARPEGMDVEPAAHPVRHVPALPWLRMNPASARSPGSVTLIFRALPRDQARPVSQPLHGL